MFPKCESFQRQIVIETIPVFRKLFFSSHFDYNKYIYSSHSNKSTTVIKVLVDKKSPKKIIVLL